MNHNPNVVRGRAVHYLLISGRYVPQVVQLPSDTCGQDQIIPEARHVAYTSGSVPIVATAPTCCDAVSNTSGRADASCWSGGISLVARTRFYNVNNCLSAFGKTADLAYSSGLDAWIGNVALRGGTLYMAFNCQSGVAAGSPSKFRLVLSGCMSGIVFAGYQCADPLRINFGNVDAPTCCACSGTTDGSAINITLETNCHPVTIGRHVGYTISGTPVVAQQNFCFLESGVVSGCGAMTCGLNATITNLSGCACLAGTWPLPYIGTEWQTVTAGSCLQPLTISMTCSGWPLSGVVCLTMDLTCGATNTGHGVQCVTPDELEDLDTTFTINMTDPSFVSGGCGTCTFQWNAMAASWSQIADNCTGVCSCATPTFSGSFDGQTVNTDCAGATTSAPCCVGGISVRVMR